MQIVTAVRSDGRKPYAPGQFGADARSERSASFILPATILVAGKKQANQPEFFAAELRAAFRSLR
jgi:hypothetical protein